MAAVLPVHAFRYNHKYQTLGALIAAKTPGATRLTMVSVDRSPTATSSLRNFFEAVSSCSALRGTTTSITMGSVGLKMDGASGPYDLFHFCYDDSTWAVHSADTTKMFKQVAILAGK
jgi:hypothetical protein